jgi:predicted nucleic acid-binding Zn ribbon protein
MNSSKLIASIVVFKELHDNDKDIYDIISEFVKSAVIQNKKWSFSSTEITKLVETDFDFKIPEAVIKTALKNRLAKTGFLRLEKGEYFINDIESKIDPNFESNFNKKSQGYKDTEEEFISYIQSKKDNKLKENELNDIKDNLKQYLLGNGVHETYTQAISALIIQRKNDKKFQERLNQIREGLVLYTGIRYTADLNDLGHWKNELTIFLDTEILFFLAGYNGQIYKEIFNDFYKLVKEINFSSKDNKNKIQLKYFDETEKDIYDFFHVATLIVENKKTLNPSKTAMKEIVNGCLTKSDIIVKRNKFFTDLKTHGIHKEENLNYYENNKYIVEGLAVVEELKQMSFANQKDFNEETCQEYLKLFTKINVLRRGINNQGFDKCKYILLTGNRFVHYLSHSKHVKTTEKDIPFATDIDYITDKFWFKLKKGFGNNDDKPKSFDIITKAQIILSSQISLTVQEKFTSMNEEFKNGKITKDEAISLNYELRESALKPEEITELNIDESINFINEFSIEEHIRERDRLKQQVIDGNNAICEIKRRDSQERCRKIKPIKRKYKTLFSIIFIVLFLLVVMLFYLVYLLINYLKEPGDSKIGIIGFSLGLIALFPIYKYFKILFISLRKKILKKKYKEEILTIIKK